VQTQIASEFNAGNVPVDSEADQTKSNYKLSHIGGKTLQQSGAFALQGALENSQARVTSMNDGSRRADQRLKVVTA
jgi:hypothetical protein